MGTVFEDKELADQAVIAVEKRIHHEDMDIRDDYAKQPVVIQTENVKTIA
jgi:hypothetical protein